MKPVTAAAAAADSVPREGRMPEPETTHKFNNVRINKTRSSKQHAPEQTTSINGEGLRV